jgi:hypothetical protein
MCYNKTPLVIGAAMLVGQVLVVSLLPLVHLFCVYVVKFSWNVLHGEQSRASTIAMQLRVEKTTPLSFILNISGSSSVDVGRRREKSVQGGSLDQISVANAADGYNKNSNKQLPKLKSCRVVAATLFSTPSTPTEHINQYLPRTLPFRMSCVIAYVAQVCEPNLALSEKVARSQHTSNLASQQEIHFDSIE